MYTVNLNTIGLFVAAGALVGLLIGLGAGLMLRGESEKPPRRGLVAALRLWRRKTDGTLWVQLEEVTVASPEALAEDQRQALFRLVRELRAWMGGTDIPEEGAPPARPASAARPRAASPPLGEETPPKAIPRPAPPAAISPAPEQDISRNPFAPFRKAFSPRKPPAAEPTTPFRDMSIAAQVDEILQEMLEGTELEDRGIRLMELPGQGMMVMVGLEKFDAVSDVPYDDIRTIIQRAVAAWERKMLGDS